MSRPSIFDADITTNGRQQWHPLEVILTAWLDMVDVGKVQTVTQDTEIPYQAFGPWYMLPYSQRQLNDTITAFHRLVDAIEARMPDLEYHPSQHTLDPEADGVPRLLSDDDIAAAQIPEGFASSFLTRVRKPRFRYIAPGLSVPTPESIKLQPFSSVARYETRPEWWQGDFPGDEDDIFPILLFSSSEKYETWRDPRPVPDFADSDRPFHWPYTKLDAYAAGLYFGPSVRGGIYEFEDSVKLVLPFPVGGHGYARTADGARFGENRRQRGEAGYVVGGGTFADLFQLGYNPFGESHDVQLEKVLVAWLGLVESGEWEIGKEGVEVGIEKWKDADISRKWHKYTVPMSW